MLRAAARLDDPRTRPQVEAQARRAIDAAKARGGAEGAKQAARIEAEAAKLRLRPPKGG